MQKLGWSERGGERASGGMLWNFQLRARGSGLGLPVRASGLGRGTVATRWSGGVIRGRCWTFRDDKAEPGERQARVGRDTIGARWDHSCDDRFGKALRVMVRMPVSGRGGRRERDGPAYSTGRAASRRMVCDWPTDRRRGRSSRRIVSLDTVPSDGRAGACDGLVQRARAEPGARGRSNGSCADLWATRAAGSGA
jgi:hypothetical protein